MLLTNQPTTVIESLHFMVKIIAVLMSGFVLIVLHPVMSAFYVDVYQPIKISSHLTWYDINKNIMIDNQILHLLTVNLVRLVILIKYLWSAQTSELTFVILLSSENGKHQESFTIKNIPPPRHIHTHTHTHTHMLLGGSDALSWILSMYRFINQQIVYLQV